jgi:undecaprenyl diphosphate synthase
MMHDPEVAKPAQDGEAEYSRQTLPRHIAIIMDGNGRWAQRRALPRHAGHRAGVSSVQKIVEACAEKGIQALTLFAFSSENWRRPQREVGLLMDLFMTSLQRQIKRLHQNDVRVKFIGNRHAFAAKLQERIADAEDLTAGNRGLTLLVAANYGGRWEITQAARRITERVQRGELRIEEITERVFGNYLSFPRLPEPDLFIRTGGEQRISNFLLWHLAYTEMYFTDVLWPDFDVNGLEDALRFFSKRQRRFGRTGEQVEQTGRPLQHTPSR